MIVRVLFISGILIFSFLNLSGQEDMNCDCYDRLLNLSIYFEKKGEFEKAIEVLEQGLSYKKKEKWTSYEYYKLGELYAFNKRFEEACEFIGRAYVMGFDMNYSSLNEYNDLIESRYWKEMLLVRDSLKREYQKNISMDYRLGIEDIRGSDQTIRRLVKVPDSTFQKLDSINYTRILKLIDEYGFPDVEKHGFDSSQGVYLILLHASMYSEEIYQEILEILDKAILEYSYRKSNLAQFIDRRENWYHKGKQIYGTWNAYGSSEFKEIEEIDGIDRRRFQYNLLRLKEQAIIEERELPSSYTVDEYPSNYFCGYKF